jgi:hypothetical protein
MRRLMPQRLDVDDLAAIDLVAREVIRAVG